MGMASIVMYTTIFLIAMAIIGGMVANEFNEYEEGKEVIAAQKEGRLTPDIEFLNGSYDGGVSTIWLDNIGQEPVEPGQVDLYLDGVFIPRADANRTLRMQPDTKNPGLWDPGEELEANITMMLTPGDYTIVASGGNTPMEAEFTVGQQENETLVAGNGQLSPDLGRNLLAAELLAVNNKLGTNLSIADPNSSVGFVMSNPSYSPYSVDSVTVLFDYAAANILADELIVEARDTDHQGAVFCSAQYGPSATVAEEQFGCSIDVAELDNIYILVNNTNGTNAVDIDYVAVNVTYVR